MAESAKSAEDATRVYIHFRSRPSLQRINAMKRAGIVVRSEWTRHTLNGVSYSRGDRPGYVVADVPVGKLAVLRNRTYVTRVETLHQYERRVEEEEGQAKTPSRLVEKARTGTGCLVQLIGGILWAVAGLVMFIWTLYVLFTVFGPIAVFVGFLLAPVTYVASIFIIWFSTGVFPLPLLTPYLVSFVGFLLMAAGGGIRGE